MEGTLRLQRGSVFGQRNSLSRACAGGAGSGTPVTPVPALRSPRPTRTSHCSEQIPEAPAREHPCGFSSPSHGTQGIKPHLVTGWCSPHLLPGFGPDGRPPSMVAALRSHTTGCASPGARNHRPPSSRWFSVGGVRVLEPLTSASVP